MTPIINDASHAGDTSLDRITEMDDKAITATLAECASDQKVATAMLVGRLLQKKMMEKAADKLIDPFSQNRVVYPGLQLLDGNSIDWFSKVLEL